MRQRGQARDSFFEPHVAARTRKVTRGKEEKKKALLLSFSVRGEKSEKMVGVAPYAIAARLKKSRGRGERGRSCFLPRRWQLSFVIMGPGGKRKREKGKRKRYLLPWSR